MTTATIDRTQRTFLRRRTRNCLKHNPTLKPLLDRLLSFGGEFVVLPATEPDLDKILQRGFFQKGWSVRMRRGRMSRCHANAAALWEENSLRASIVTGYAMSSDGIWRQHSWVIDRWTCVHKRKKLARIYETTTRRVAYFGFQLTHEEAQIFASDNFL